jgi:beta-lactamase superfamily II metal-dependent hydrolase
VETHGLTLTIAGPSQASLDQLKQRWEAWLATRAVGAFDTSYTNLSSIMFLAESGGKSILFTGDGRGDALLAALRRNGRLAGDTLHVDVLKLPHHGSSRNVPPALFTTITADRYVISADGENGNPDQDTLQAIAAAAKAAGRPFEIWITNETDTTRWFRAHYDPAEYRYRWVLLPEGHDAFVLDLDLPDPAAAIG